MKFITIVTSQNVYRPVFEKRKVQVHFLAYVQSQNGSICFQIDMKSVKRLYYRWTFKEYTM